jgi:hypothetical protein
MTTLLIRKPVQIWSSLEPNGLKAQAMLAALDGC